MPIQIIQLDKLLAAKKTIKVRVASPVIHNRPEGQTPRAKTRIAAAPPEPVALRKKMEQQLPQPATHPAQNRPPATATERQPTTKISNLTTIITQQRMVAEMPPSLLLLPTPVRPQKMLPSLLLLPIPVRPQEMLPSLLLLPTPARQAEMLPSLLLLPIPVRPAAVNKRFQVCRHLPRMAVKLKRSRRPKVRPRLLCPTPTSAKPQPAVLHQAATRS